MPSKLQVWRGKAKSTPGGLQKKDIMKNKKGKLVSRKQSAAAKRKSNLKHFLIRPRSTRARKKVKRLGS